MIIKIDYREKQLVDLCNDYATKYNIKNIEIVTENLPIGDIILSQNEIDRIIIERKSLSDLASSIKDGRYNEQSFRLTNCGVHNHNIIYLIEGDWSQYNKSKYNKSINQHTLMSSIVSIQYYKGFSVYRTLDISETALYIIYFADKLQREMNKKNPYYNTLIESSNISNISNISNLNNIMINENSIIKDNQNHNEKEHYSEVIKKVKKDNITIHNIGEILLCQIPGVSSQSAIAIMNKYKTIKNLIQHLEKDNTCLDNIFIGTEKPRKLNKNCKSSIYKYLLQIENEIIVQ